MGSSYFLSSYYWPSRSTGGIDARGSLRPRRGKAHLKKPMGRLRLLSLRHDSGVVVPGTASAVDYGREVFLPGEPVVSELASVRGLGTALNRSTAKP